MRETKRDKEKERVLVVNAQPTGTVIYGEKERGEGGGGRRASIY